jgi:hypothetical protein
MQSHHAQEFNPCGLAHCQIEAAALIGVQLEPDICATASQITTEGSELGRHPAKFTVALATGNKMKKPSGIYAERPSRLSAGL